jgi:hypothetical protein
VKKCREVVQGFTMRYGDVESRKAKDNCASSMATNLAFLIRIYVSNKTKFVLFTIIIMKGR